MLIKNPNDGVLLNTPSFSLTAVNDLASVNSFLSKYIFQTSLLEMTNHQTSIKHTVVQNLFGQGSLINFLSPLGPNKCGLCPMTACQNL